MKRTHSARAQAFSSSDEADEAEVEYRRQRQQRHHHQAPRRDHARNIPSESEDEPSESGGSHSRPGYVPDEAEDLPTALPGPTHLSPGVLRQAQLLPPQHGRAFHRSKLACQIRNDGVTSADPNAKNLNAHLTEPLEKLEKLVTSRGDKSDPWRGRAYSKTATLLRKLTYTIRTAEQIDEFQRRSPGVGPKTAEKLKEILSTGGLRRLEALESHPRTAAMAALSGIHGVGPKTADRWYHLGLRTVEDAIMSPQVSLTPTLLTGIKFYHDKQQRIPRSEVRAIREYVAGICNQVLPGCTVEACGSYRRGKNSSGDVDILVSHDLFDHRVDPQGQLQKLFAGTVLQLLGFDRLLREEPLAGQALLDYFRRRAELVPKLSAKVEERVAAEAAAPGPSPFGIGLDHRGNASLGDASPTRELSARELLRPKRRDQASGSDSSIDSSSDRVSRAKSGPSRGSTTGAMMQGGIGTTAARASVVNQAAANGDIDSARLLGVIPSQALSQTQDWSQDTEVEEAFNADLEALLNQDMRTPGASRSASHSMLPGSETSVQIKTEPMDDDDHRLPAPRSQAQQPWRAADSSFEDQLLGDNNDDDGAPTAEAHPQQQGTQRPVSHLEHRAERKETLLEPESDADPAANLETYMERIRGVSRALPPAQLLPFLTGLLSRGGVNPKDAQQLRHSGSTGPVFSKHAFLEVDEGGSRTFMGFCRLPEGSPAFSGIHRRLDIKFYPMTLLPFAILYFTGSDHFNRSMRHWAKSRNLTLSDKGLKLALRGPNDTIKSYPIYCKNEKEIFDALELEYVPPHERNCFDFFGGGGGGGSGDGDGGSSSSTSTSSRKVTGNNSSDLDSDSDSESENKTSSRRGAFLDLADTDVEDDGDDDDGRAADSQDTAITVSPPTPPGISASTHPRPSQQQQQQKPVQPSRVPRQSPAPVAGMPSSSSSSSSLASSSTAPSSAGSRPRGPAMVPRRGKAGSRDSEGDGWARSDSGGWLDASLWANKR